MKWSLSLKLLTFCIILFYSGEPKAQNIVENQTLSFGRFILASNSSVKSINLLSTGSYVADSDFIFFLEPQMANITLDDYPPLTELEVTLGTTVLDPLGAVGANFFISDVFTNPIIINTDASGSATFDIGARLNSDGRGDIHSDSDYEGIYSVSVAPAM